LCAGLKVSLILIHSLFYLYLILLFHNIALSCKWIISCELQVGKTARIAEVETFLLQWGGQNTGWRADVENQSLVSVRQSLLSSVRTLPLILLSESSCKLNLQNVLSSLGNGTFRLYLYVLFKVLMFVVQVNTSHDLMLCSFHSSSLLDALHNRIYASNKTGSVA
jgi:hypothetical protein